jgi:hypothetical protein
MAAPELAGLAVGTQVTLETSVDEVRSERRGRYRRAILLASGGRPAFFPFLFSSHTRTPHTHTSQAPITGEVFAFDPASRTLALRQPGSAPFNARVRLLAESAIGRVVSATPPAARPPADLPYVDPAKLAEREEKAVAVRVGFC